MTKTKTARIPTSKAKTAYGLLSEIAALTLAEPKRMRMRIWGGRMMPEHFADLDPEDLPACGTVGCIGGWVETLKPTLREAWTMLSLEGTQLNELFHPTALVTANNQGTPAHAQAVVKHIRRFQKQYAAQLKAKRV